MQKSRQKVIYYVGWNDKTTCITTFFTKKAARKHATECDYKNKGAFIIEVPAKIAPIISTESRVVAMARKGRERQLIDKHTSHSIYY